MCTKTGLMKKDKHELDRDDASDACSAAGGAAAGHAASAVTREEAGTTALDDSIAHAGGAVRQKSCHCRQRTLEVGKL